MIGLGWRWLTGRVGDSVTAALAAVASFQVAWGARLTTADLWLDAFSPLLFVLTGLAFVLHAFRPTNYRVAQIALCVAPVAPFHRFTITVVDWARDSPTSQVNPVLRTGTWLGFTTLCVGYCLLHLRLLHLRKILTSESRSAEQWQAWWQT